jgi:hypothetical protein
MARMIVNHPGDSLETQNIPAVLERLRTKQDTKTFIIICLSELYGRLRRSPNVELFSDAEGREDEIENVVRGGLAGEGIESPEGAIKIQQDHFVWDGRRIG